jgi:transcriptional regulator with XRE-family HTH domain
MLREKMGVSQTRLAEFCGVSKATVINWEKGKRIPSITKVVLLARVLSSDVAYLSGEADIQQEPQGEDPPRPAITKRMKMAPYYAVRDAAVEDATYGTHNDRLEAVQILRRAIEELEAPEVERLNELKSGGVAG